VKKLLLVCAIGLAALTSASADEPRGSLGLGRMHGLECWCQPIRLRIKLGDMQISRELEGSLSYPYQRVQQRIARNCNPATVWKNACR
jgi:hypothetical protein